MLHRHTLDRTGGLGALVDLLAEDNVLGQRVRELGLSIGLADTLVATTIPESSLAALSLHEIRWLRAIGQSAPIGLAFSTLQYPLFWAILACALSGGAPWSLAFCAGSWAARALSVSGVSTALRRKAGYDVPVTGAWLAPLRDMLSVIEIAASYWVEAVVWRGHRVSARGRREAGCAKTRLPEAARHQQCVARLSGGRQSLRAGRVHGVEDVEGQD